MEVLLNESRRDFLDMPKLYLKESNDANASIRVQKILQRSQTLERAYHLNGNLIGNIEAFEASIQRIFASMLPNDAEYNSKMPTGKSDHHFKDRARS